MSDPAGRLFSPRDLAAFRAMAEANHPDTATRYQAVDTPGAGGGVTTTHVATAQVTGARLEPVTVVEGIAEDTVIAEGEWLLALPCAALVEPRDQFVVTGTALDGSTWRRTVDVIGTPGPHTWESERVVRCTSRGGVTRTHYLTLTSALTPTGGMA